MCFNVIVKIVASLILAMPWMVVVLLFLQMHKKHTVQSVLIGKDNFAVTVYPNVDYAFIVALIVILDEINEDANEG